MHFRFSYRGAAPTGEPHIRRRRYRRWLSGAALLAVTAFAGPIGGVRGNDGIADRRATPGTGALRSEELVCDPAVQPCYLEPAVTPDGGNLPTGSGTVVFAVQNIGTDRGTAVFTVACGGAVSSCSRTPASATLAVNQSTNVTVTYTSTGPGQIRLHAEWSLDASYADDGYVGAYTVDVTPDAASYSLVPGVGATQLFSVKNTSPTGNTLSLTAQCTGAALAAVCSVAPSSLSLGAGESGTATVTYATGSAGGTTGLVVMRAQGADAVDSGSVNVEVPAEFRVAASPKGSVTTVATSSSASQVFTVINAGNVSTSLTFAASCAGSLVVSGSCSASPASATLAAGANTNVTVSFQTAASGTATVALLAKHTASPSLTRDSGWVALSLTSPVASVALSGAGATAEKSACLHFALRPGVGTECGVLRVAHVLPAVRTLNKVRAPTLLYYYDQAGYWDVIGVNIGRLSTASVPDSVRAILYKKNPDGTFTEHERRAYAGSAWSTTTVQRIGLILQGMGEAPSRIVPYRVQVDFKYPAQGWVAAAPPLDDEVAIVRREMASGWHVAGVEGLYPGQPGGAVLWVGGDGSTRKYALYDSVGSNRVFIAPSVDRPDTLLQSKTDSWYTRVAENGLRVRFDATGLHRETINRLGHVTAFSYVTGTRRLSTITVPPAGAGLVYQFSYGTDGRLASVSAPGTAGARITTLTPGGNPGVISRITDPDSSHVDFEYSIYGAGRLMIAYTDRRGTRTALAQESLSPTVYQASTPVGSQSAAHTFRTARGIGAGVGSAPTPIDSVYTRYDGPRTEVADVAKIWLNALGGPTKIVNPVGASVDIAYGDARFPGLGTRVTQTANGYTRAAAYDARGHIVVDTAYNPLGDNRNAVTSYAWHPRWDAVVRATSPEGLFTELAYDSATGSLQWQQTGGSQYRVTFGYHADSVYKGLPKSTRSALGDADEYAYDASRGNLSQIKTPLGFRTLFETDVIGRDTLTIAPIDTAISRLSSDSVRWYGQRVRVRYNSAGLVSEQWTENGPGLPAAGVDTVRVRAETLHVQTEYDSGGLPLVVRRRAIPDSNQIGWVVTSTNYDALGRDTSATGEVSLQKRYDLAGNIIWTSRGDSSVYDAAGRLTKRLLPAVPAILGDPRWGYAEPNGAPADSETFAYSVDGHLTRADNRYASIRRGYYPNGALRGDTAVVQVYWLDGSYAGAPVEHRYDLDGRPVQMRHSMLSGNAPGSPRDSVLYSYHGETGVLARVTDAQGYQFTFAEDVAGRRTSLTFPGGVTQQYRYDGDSRVRYYTVGGATDTLGRDARGKVLKRTNAGVSSRTYSMTYTLLGNLKINQRGIGSEEYAIDALGNSRTVSVSGTNGGVFGPFTDGDWRRFYYEGRTRVAGATKYREAEPYLGEFRPDADYSYDAFGNEIQSMSFAYEMREMAPGAFLPVVDTTRTSSSYDANGKLRFVLSTMVERRWNSDSTRIQTHEYRYDALGRRILARYRGPYECTLNTTKCRATLDRQIWDGDHLIAETRDVERNLPPDMANFDGLVVYTHGPEIDVPLSIVRKSNGNQCVFNISPHSDWRGRLASGSYNSSVPSCASVAWPGNDMFAYRQGPRPETTQPWNGSLIDMSADQSGLQYMRNRYYDPKKGQFTQADPIGIAGGLNVYGYGAGDPVAYRDPLGLTGCSYYEVACWMDQLTAWGGGTGFAGRVLVPTIATVVSVIGMDAVEESAAAAANGSNMAKANLAITFALSAIPGGGRGGGLVIGKMERLVAEGAVEAGEHTLLPKLAGNLGSAKANWARNAGALRAEMGKGLRIRDASANAVTGALQENTGFLRAERNLLQSRGWTYDPPTRMWYPPSR